MPTVTKRLGLNVSISKTRYILSRGRHRTSATAAVWAASFAEEVMIEIINVVSKSARFDETAVANALAGPVGKLLCKKARTVGCSRHVGRPGELVMTKKQLEKRKSARAVPRPGGVITLTGFTDETAYGMDEAADGMDDAADEVADGGFGDVPL